MDRAQETIMCVLRWQESQLEDKPQLNGVHCFNTRQESVAAWEIELGGFVLQSAECSVFCFVFFFFPN